MSKMVKLKYKGGRILVKSYFNRRPYVFKKETDYSCDVPEEFSRILLLTGKYEVVPIINVVQAEEKDPLVCDICGFKAKSEYGLLVHKRRHKKEEK